MSMNTLFLTFSYFMVFNMFKFIEFLLGEESQVSLEQFEILRGV